MPHVTISDITPRETFTVGAGGSSGPFTLPSGFVIFTPSADIKFYDDGVLLSYVDPPGSSTQFKFSGTQIDGGFQGGTLTIGGLATSGSVMAAVRDTPIERTTDFSYPSSTLDLEGLNTQLDKLFAIFQDREATQGRSLTQPVSDAVNIDYIPSSTGRAGKFLAFDSDGDPIASVGATSTGAVISAYASTFLDDATEAEFKQTVNLESNVDFIPYVASSSGSFLYGSTTGAVWVSHAPAGVTMVPSADTFLILDASNNSKVAFAGPQGLAATQAQMEAGTTGQVFATPGNLHFHPGVAKCWGYATYSTGFPTLRASYNITSISDDGVGLLGVTIATDFSSTSYAVNATAGTAAGDSNVSEDSDLRTAGVFSLSVINSASAGVDPVTISFTAFGDL